MGTTCSSGLNNLLSTSAVTQTTLPNWYNNAQQNIISGAQSATQAAPDFQNTVGQNAITNLQNPNNQFGQASNALGQISSGAANPWIVCLSSGQVCPNVNTSMGGLFQAQNQQLNQLMPTTLAPVQGANIGSGNFGSLRGQTAVDTTKANAFATLAAQQMQSALQNQATGVQAGTGLGNVTNQQLGTQLTAGNTQMNAPFQNLGSYANLINDISVPGTVKQQNQMSPFSQIGAVGAGANTLLSMLGIGGGNALSAVGSNLKDWWNNASAPVNNQNIPPDQVTGPAQTIDPNSGYVAPNVEE